MRMLWFALTIAVAMVAVIGGAILIGLAAPGGAPAGVSFAAGAAWCALVMVPVLLGTWLSTEDALSGASTSRRSFRWGVAAIAVTELVAAGVIVVCAVFWRAPWWIPVTMLGAAVCFVAVAVWLGPVVRRSVPRTRAVSSDYGPDDRVRDRRRTVKVVGIGFVVSVLLMGVLSLVTDLEPLEVAVMSVVLTLFTVMGACYIVIARLTDAVRALFGGDAAKLRVIGKAVIRRGADIPLSDMPEARRYADLMTVYLPYQLVGFGSLYLAIILVQMRSLLTGSGFGFRGWLIVVLAVLLVAFVALGARQLVRVRRFLRQSKLTAPSASAATRSADAAA